MNHCSAKRTNAVAEIGYTTNMIKTVSDCLLDVYLYTCPSCDVLSVATWKRHLRESMPVQTGFFSIALFMKNKEKKSGYKTNEKKQQSFQTYAK